MRTPQPAGSKGSLKWIQLLTNKCPKILNDIITHELKLDSVRIEWLSPLESDEYGEYRDGAFLDKLELSHLNDALKGFWPVRGPQWDALGRAKDSEAGPFFLVEAKANVPEHQNFCNPFFNPFLRQHSPVPILTGFFKRS